MINGIPCRIKTPDEKGNPSNIETFYFASFRKCPELAKFPKEIASCEKDLKVVRRKIQVAEERLQSAVEDSDIDAAGKAIEELSNKLLDLNDRMFGSFKRFVDTGLKAAGYDDASIERFSSYIDFERFPELFSKARMGSGVCDFF